MGRALAYGPVLLVLALAAVALVVVYQFPQPRTVDVGAGDDGFYLRGFYPPERNEHADFRWTGERAHLVVPAAAGNAWRLTLRLSGTRPAGVPPPTVRVLADDRFVTQLETSDGFREFTVRFRRDPLPPGDLVITLDTPTFDPVGATDDRALGVAVDAVELEPEPAGLARPALPPPTYAAVLLALLALAAGLLALLGVGRGLIAALLAGGLVGIVAGELGAPDVTARYLPDLLLVVVALMVVLLGLRPLVRRLFAAGGVALTPREERILLGIFAFGAAFHLAGVFFPGFWAHDIGFQVHRLEDVLRGRLVFDVLSSEWGYRRTPYPPALYMLLAPLAVVARDHSLPLRLVPPLIDASSVFLIAYLLRRCRLPEPAPMLAAFFYTLVPAGSQLLWWGFFANLFGQWATLLVLTIAIGHYADLARPKVFLALVLALALALLSHPGTFALTVALLPPLAVALALAAGRGGDRRGAALLLLALALSGLLVYALYYRHFAGTLVEQVRDVIAGKQADPGAPTDRGWEDEYIRNRVFRFPFALYFVASGVAGLWLAWGRQRRLGWVLLTMLLTSSLFAAVHVLFGVWVRYFVFLGPALAIGAGVVVAWLARRGRLGRWLAYGAVGYGAVSGLVFWLTVTAGGQRSPYP